MGKTLDLSKFQNKEQSHSEPDHTEPIPPKEDAINKKEKKTSSDTSIQTFETDKKSGIKKEKRGKESKKEADKRDEKMWAVINDLTREVQLLKQKSDPTLSTAIPQEIFQDLANIIDECWTRYIKWGYGPKALKVKKIADYFKITLEDPAKLLEEKNQNSATRKTPEQKTHRKHK